MALLLDHLPSSAKAHHVVHLTRLALAHRRAAVDPLLILAQKCRELPECASSVRALEDELGKCEYG